MRRGNGGGIVRGEDGSLLAVMLGADPVAEHEMGIERLRITYGIVDSAEGLERRRITVVPEKRIVTGSVVLKTRDYRKPRSRPEETTWHGLISHRYPQMEGDEGINRDDVACCELHPLGDQDMCGSWDGASFGFLARDKSVVDEIHAAIRYLDLCIGFFGGSSTNPFSRGLGLIIASRVPQHVSDKWLEADRDARRLKDAALATGVAARLQEAGCHYHALSPRWENDERTNVVFWLNPRDQHKHNFGWFSPGELMQWADGTGPVIKKEES